MLRRALPLFAALVGLSCSAQPRDPCAFDTKTFPVVFLGDAYARGTIVLEHRPQGVFVGRARLEKVQGQVPTDEPAMDLEGNARCAHGIVKVELGAGTTQDGGLRVLGGELQVVLPRHGLIDEPFGQWRAEVQSETWTTTRRMGGPWVTKTATQGLANR